MAIDPAARNPEYQRLIRLQTEAFAKNTPYHSLELNDGRIIPGLIGIPELRARLDSYPLPQDLRGQRVLDIGAASGWNSFECERRGAEVVAVDYVEYEELTVVKRLRHSKVEYAIVDLEEVTPERFGFFDYVLFFGVLYHLRHPLLGLERVCAVTRGAALIESFVVDEEPSPQRCHLEFYETDELGGQIDNWFGPTTQCLLAMTRAAGFARAEFLYTHPWRAGMLAQRRWKPVEQAAGAQPPFLRAVVNSRHDDIVFQPGKDEYLVLWFFHDGPLTREDVFVEVERFGVPAIFLSRHDAGYWQVNSKVPPGLLPGDLHVRVGIRNAGYSEPVRIRMLPAGAERRFGETVFLPEEPELPPTEILLVENTTDKSRIFRGYRNEKLVCHFLDAGATLDLSRVQLTIDGNPYPLLSIERPRPGEWRINARLKGLSRGSHQLRVRTARSALSEPVGIEWDPVFDFSDG